MKGLVLCNKGIEEIAALDIKGKSVVFDGYAIFDFEKKEELCKLCYCSQAAQKIVLILNSFEFKSEKEIIEGAKKLDLKKWLNSERSFKVKALVEDNEINHEELEGEIGETVIASIKGYKQKVDLDNPDITLFVFVYKNDVYFGVDFSGIDLSKRNYRIFSSPKNIKSTVAYAMVRLSGYKKNEVLVDPFCISGSIPIEAALFSNSFPVRFFEKDELIFNKFMKYEFDGIDKKISKGKVYALDSEFRNVDSSKKNAKIAGVNKAINFSRLGIEWLDTKFDKESVDRIVTCLPNITKFSNKKEILKIYKEFFYQSEFVLSKKGSIVVCTKNVEDVKEASIEKGFKVLDEKEIWQGKEKMFLVKFCK